MLSDEERELIEKIQNGNKIGIYELIRTFKREGIENFITVRRKYIDIMINLIEKQSKEIEELKEIYQKGYVNGCVSKVYEINKKWKDKIKAKMKEKEWSLENYDCTESDYKQSQAIGAWVVLQSLLEKE